MHPTLERDHQARMQAHTKIEFTVLAFLASNRHCYGSIGIPSVLRWPWGRPRDSYQQFEICLTSAESSTSVSVRLVVTVSVYESSSITSTCFIERSFGKRASLIGMTNKAREPARVLGRLELPHQSSRAYTAPDIFELSPLHRMQGKSRLRRE